MNYRQGLYRIPGHFLIWAAVPLALGYGAYYFGLPDLTVRERLLVFAVSAVGFYHSELRQWETWRQTAGKTGIDFFAKVAGVGLGLALVNFWWSQFLVEMIAKPTTRRRVKMGNIVRAITLLPLILRLVEFIYGAKKGQIKKEAALKVFFGLANMFFPGLDTPEIRQVIGDLIDQLVSLLTETGVLPAHSTA